MSLTQQQARETSVSVTVHYHGEKIKARYFKRDGRDSPFYVIDIGSDVSIIIDDANDITSFVEGIEAAAMKATRIQ